jgi:hypothetical protein
VGLGVALAEPAGGQLGAHGRDRVAAGALGEPGLEAVAQRARDRGGVDEGERRRGAARVRGAAAHGLA